MSLREQDFNPAASLWPKAPFRPAVHPTAAGNHIVNGQRLPNAREVAEQMSGVPGGDLGVLRVNAGIWEIWYGGWVPFDPTYQRHIFAANMHHRYGYWSFGDPRADDGQTYIECWNVIERHAAAQEGRPVREFPWGSMEHQDIIYHPTLRDDLWRRSVALEPRTPPVVTPTPTKPQPPVPVTPTPPVTPPTPPTPPAGPHPALISLQTVKDIAEQRLASIPGSGGGKPAIDARHAHRVSLTSIIEETKKGGAQ